jgi:hypothetical protein
LFSAAGNFDLEGVVEEIGKCFPLKNLAEREGFEPSIQVLARITV